MPPVFRHGKNARVIVGITDLSTMFRELQVATPVDMAETTAFGSANKSFVPGIPDGTVQLQGMFSAQVGDVEPVLAAALGDDSQTVILTAAPEGLVVGRHVYAMESYEKNFTAHAAVHDIVGVQAEFQGTGGTRSGVSLHDVITPETASGNSTGQQSPTLAATVSGGWMIAHLTALTGGTAPTVTFKIQDSADNASFADLLTTMSAFSATGAKIARLAAGTTVRQYVRGVWTITGAPTNVLFHLNFTRLFP